VEGFERLEQPGKRVIIIGAGMAGLVAGYELTRAGHDPVILEAQNRVGGRIYTLRKFAPGLYAEAGAMRIPRVHDLTLGYIEHFGLQLRPFVMGNPKGLVFVGGKRMTAEQAGLTPDELGFAVAEHERGRSAFALWEEATQDLRAWLETDHPRIRDVYEVGASHAWYDDRFANGAFALFEAGQQTQLQADIVRPEGRIHFAGEHCSLYHAWIQGALESGLRAALAIHEAPAPAARPA
jgi:monoamine oxidase